MKENTYPSWSVYLLEGGQLKHPYNLNRRVAIDSLPEARVAAVRCHTKYKGRYDVIILRYDKPYTSTIEQFINKSSN